MALDDTQLRVIPFQITTTEYSVMIVLQEGNLERMRAYDPVEVSTRSFGPAFSRLTLRDVIVTYATDDDVREVERLAQQGEIRDMLRLLTRGFRYRPDRGDHDEGPLHLKHP